MGGVRAAVLAPPFAIAQPLLARSPSSRLRFFGLGQSCAFWSFDCDRPDRYLRGAGLRAAAGGGLVNFPRAAR